MIPNISLATIGWTIGLLISFSYSDSNGGFAAHPLRKVGQKFFLFLIFGGQSKVISSSELVKEDDVSISSFLEQ